MKGKIFGSLVAISLLPLAACEETPQTKARGSQLTVDKSSPSIKRWYNSEQVGRGNILFQEHCATCHKPDASGTPNWREPNAEGKLPPPPLNGTAHAWHHPLAILRRTVRIGGVPLGGSMPGFADKLNAQQIDDILAWVQSHWPEKIYEAWDRMNNQAAKPPQSINKGT